MVAVVFYGQRTKQRVQTGRADAGDRERYRLPTVLSQEEAAQLIYAAPTPFYRTILMTLYGTGARRTELTRLKSQRYR